MTDALKRLIEAVETGQSRPKLNGLARGAWPNNKSIWTGVSAAAHGSLDAAKALHDTLLPDMWWQIDARGCVCLSGYIGNDKFRTDEKAETPARAWLLAILRAKLTEAEYIRDPHDV